MSDTSSADGPTRIQTPAKTVPARRHAGYRAQFATTKFAQFLGQGWLPAEHSDLLGLPLSIGNRALQSILSSTATPTSPVHSCSCGGACAMCSQREEGLSSALAVRTEPLEEEEEGVPLIPAVPVDASKAGGSVVCNKGNFLVWINPTLDPCVTTCARKHEEKHIADFTADPNYKDICKGIPDGETFNYRSCGDAARFEDAASDLEIDCLAKAIPGASAGCQKTMQTRKDVTLPNYKKQVRSSCGC